MEKVLIVVDMQKDFVDGALGTPEAVAIVERVKARVQAHAGPCIFTQDTHPANYLETLEGQNLPVPHCIEGTEGWRLIPALRPLAEGRRVVQKPTFGSRALAGETSNTFACHRVPPHPRPPPGPGPP